MCSFIIGAIFTPLKISFLNSQYKAQLDSKIGFLPCQSLDTNKFGYNDSEWSDLDKKIVGLFGDSYTFGVHLDKNQTISHFLNQKLGERFVSRNYGVIGYGPDQSMLLLDTLINDVNFSKIILIIFSGNDVEDVAKNKLFNLSSNGELIYNGSKYIHSLELPFILRGAKILFSLGGWPASEYSNRFFLDKRDPNLYEIGEPIFSKLIIDYNIKLKQKGIDFGVVILPDVESGQNLNAINSNKQFNNERAYKIFSFLKDNNIKALNAYDEFIKYPSAKSDLFLNSDSHLSERGSNLIADAIYKNFFKDS